MQPVTSGEIRNWTRYEEYRAALALSEPCAIDASAGREIYLSPETRWEFALRRIVSSGCGAISHGPSRGLAIANVCELVSRKGGGESVVPPRAGNATDRGTIILIVDAQIIEE